MPEQRASGSGVIITEDGYIVTNNHVIDGSDEINVTLGNKKSYKATLIGADPSTDIAVIKIEASGLIPVSTAVRLPLGLLAYRGLNRGEKGFIHALVGLVGVGGAVRRVGGAVVF